MYIESENGIFQTHDGAGPAPSLYIGTTLPMILQIVIMLCMVLEETVCGVVPSVAEVHVAFSTVPYSLCFLHGECLYLPLLGASHGKYCLQNDGG